MKFPNGFGTIAKLAGARRRPWAVRKTLNGHQVYLAYFSTYEEALFYLVELNRAPWVLGSDLTFADAYHLEMAERRKRIADITAKNYDIAFKKASSIHEKKLSDLKVADLQSVITEMSSAGIRAPMQKKVRQVFHNVFRYAIKYQLLPGSADISRADDAGKPLSYHQYLRCFQKVMERARCRHTPHECRHTCATKFEEVGANRLAVKRILGHAVRDITLGVYTHKSIQSLKKAVDLL